ncbi:FeoB-associated Cys-rich membrane protein [Tissierella sp.]|nr:FeoB-associated Cys-rich membrane protein [Tissierella sp.]
MINYIIAGLIVISLFFAIRNIIKNRKKGGCAGCSSCSGCGTTKAYKIK